MEPTTLPFPPPQPASTPRGDSPLPGDAGDSWEPILTVPPGGWGEIPRVLGTAHRDRAVTLRPEGGSPGDWPSDVELGQLVAAGVVEVEVPWELELGGARPEQSVHFIRFLRDSLSHGLQVRWSGRLAAPLPDWILNHLEPPSRGGGAEAPDLAAWRAAHAYGRCFWRSGPGFALVKDTRPGREAAQFMLDDGPTLRLFRALQVPTRVEELGADAGVERALSDLLEEWIAVRLGDWVVALPYRMRRWPIPYLAI